MGASCYLCGTGNHNPIPNTEVGDAVGVCQVCNVLACQGHGLRDANYPRWICVICDPALLAVAAVLQSRGVGTQGDLLSGVSETVIAAARPIRSAERHFSGRSRESWWWVEEDARTYVATLDSLRNDKWRHLWEPLTTDGKLLVACAFAIVDRLEVPEHELIELLRRMREWVPARA